MRYICITLSLLPKEKKILFNFFFISLQYWDWKVEFKINILILNSFDYWQYMRCGFSQLYSWQDTRGTRPEYCVFTITELAQVVQGKSVKTRLANPTLSYHVERSIVSKFRIKMPPRALLISIIDSWNFLKKCKTP